MKRNITSPPKNGITKRVRAGAKGTSAQIVRARPSLYRAPRNANGGPWPLKKTCQLVYTEKVDVGVTTGRGVYTFSANGLYDPNITGTGHQPLYFDQLMALYNHYTVIRSRIEVRPFGLGVTSVLGSVYIDDDTSQTAEAETAAERPGAVSQVWTTNATGSMILSKDWSAYQIFGPNVQNNSLFRGSSSSNPTEQSYFALSFFDPSLSSFTQSIFVQITFTAVFSEQKTIAQS